MWPEYADEIAIQMYLVLRFPEVVTIQELLEVAQQLRQRCPLRLSSLRAWERLQAILDYLSDAQSLRFGVIRQGQGYRAIGPIDESDLAQLQKSTRLLLREEWDAVVELANQANAPQTPG